MIAILLILLAVATIFVAPLAYPPVQQAIARRAAERARADAEQESRREQARVLRERRAAQLRHQPDLPGMESWLRYEDQVRNPLAQEVDETQRVFNQSEQEYLARKAARGDQEKASSGYRILMLAALALFPIVFVLSLVLDYLIFRGLHPAGTVLIPAGLACLAVIGITTGSVMFLGTGRHGLAVGVSDYARRVMTLAGAMLAGGVAIYMTTIAPNRSEPAGQAAITTAERLLNSDETSVPRAGPEVIRVDRLGVEQAKVRLAHQEEVDRLSAGTLAVVEIPLAEGAVLGGELCLFDLARRRREQARQGNQQATDDLQQADARFQAELMAGLIAQGHGEDVVYQILTRLANLPQPAYGAAALGRGVTVPGPDGAGSLLPGQAAAEVPDDDSAPITYVDPAASPVGSPIDSPVWPGAGPAVPAAEMPDYELDVNA